jgi:plasmid maintenance system antidote protein VapI
MRISTGPHAGQGGLRAWLSDRGVKHAWAARRLGYTQAYFSRVINGRDPLTNAFRRRCRDILGVPNDVWQD